ncbi:MAG TPA: ATP-binding protein [Bacteroidota bacterium]
MIRFRTIRVRLTFWYTSLVAAALLLSGLTSFYLTRITLYENLDTSLRDESKWLKDFIEPRVQHIPPERSTVSELDRLKKNQPDSVGLITDQDIWDEIFLHTLLNPRQQVIQILDRNKRALYQSPLLEGTVFQTGEVLRGTTQLTTITDESGRELRLAITKGEFVTIFVAYPLDELYALLDNVLTVRLFLSPLTILIALVGGLALAHRLLKPVDDLARKVETITAQNLNVQLPQSVEDDEVGRLTKTFNEMTERLHASFSQVNRFSAEASHELRTPLTIMRGEIEVALRNAKLTKPARELLESIHQELVRLSSVVENLMTLVRSESGRLVFQSTEVALDKILTEIAEDTRTLAIKKRIKVELGAFSSTVVSGDPMRLRQLFLNLVDNAIKYTPPRGTISFTLERVNGHAVVRVKDTGIGIPRKDLQKVFDRFYRVQRSQQNNPGGSGLGLSIAKWIAEAHDGAIQVQSRNKKGSTFIISLPLSEKR